jgi:hypothetical protein
VTTDFCILEKLVAIFCTILTVSIWVLGCFWVIAWWTSTHRSCWTNSLGCCCCKYSGMYSYNLFVDLPMTISYFQRYNGGTNWFIETEETTLDKYEDFCLTGFKRCFYFFSGGRASLVLLLLPNCKRYRLFKGNAIQL